MRKIFFFLLPLIFSLQSPPKVFAVVQKWPVKLHSNSSVSLEGGENNNILFDSDVTTIYNKLTVYADADFDFSTEFELAAKSLEELEVDVFDAETSQPSDSVTINGKQLYQDSDGWILLLAYEHKAGENNAFVSKTAPSSPTEGYSHIWLEDLGLAASDVDSVKFYCKTSAHSRVMHFSSSTDWVKNAVVTGTYTGNQVSYWTSGTTKFSDHTANLPDAADLGAAYNELTNAIFYVGNTYHWGMKIQGSRWECDDMSFNTADTLHQIWFKRKSSSGA